jgi:type II secretory pathway pseudopilin PulG
MFKEKQQHGFSLVELVIFIVIIGVIAGSLLIGLNQAAFYSGIPRNLPQASYLANARMQIILMNRAINGYSALNDPCTATPSLAICTPLASYASTNNFTVSTPTITGSNPKTITINVTSKSSTLSTQASLAMTRISKELQQAISFSAINPTNVTFRTVNGTNITYSWASPNITRTGSSAQILNNQVTAFSLSYYQDSFATTATLTAVKAVTISMTLSNGTESVPLINTVYLPNIPA